MPRCAFDFHEREEGPSRTLKGDLSRFDILKTTPNNEALLVLKMEFFNERLESFRYPHCALLLTCLAEDGTTSFMRIDRTQARDSCYIGNSQSQVRNGNPYRQSSCLPQVLEQCQFLRPIEWPVFRDQLLRQSQEDFTKVRRNCKWFSFTLWQFILETQAESVYGPDDLPVIEQFKRRDCKAIHDFMRWTYWLGSWIYK